MKNLLLFAFALVFCTKGTTGQVSKVMPIDADHFYANSMPLLRPTLKKIILQSAKAIENRKINTDSLSAALHRNAALKDMGNNEMDGIIVLIMVQASKDADADLKQMVLQISHSEGQKKAANNSPGHASPKDAEDDLTSRQNLQLQMIIDRKSDMAEEVSGVMKKISGTQQNIINNLK